MNRLRSTKFARRPDRPVQLMMTNEQILAAVSDRGTNAEHDWYSRVLESLASNGYRVTLDRRGECCTLRVLELDKQHETAHGFRLGEERPVFIALVMQCCTDPQRERLLPGYLQTFERL